MNTIVINWLSISRIAVGQEGPTLTVNQRFKSSFGISPAICQSIWNKISTIVISTLGMRAFKPQHLLWGLMFLKCYETEIIMAQTFKTI